MRGLFHLLLLPLLAACAQTGIDCNLTKVVQLPIEVQAHLLTVPVGINGKWTRLIVDSGAERTTLSEAAAKRLDLTQDPHSVSHMTGIGGSYAHPDVLIDSMVIGGVRFPISRVPVSTLNFDRNAGLTADGLLGADILLAFEMDIDVPHNTLTLYRARHCPGMRPNWPEPAVEVQGITSRKDRMLIPFTLDGLSGLAVLDTGAQGTVVGIDMARRLGLTEAAMAADPVTRHRGAGPAIIQTHVHQFQDLRIGPAVVTGPALSVMPNPAGMGDALVGEDFLQGRRVCLSFPTRQLFVSPVQQDMPR